MKKMKKFLCLAVVLFLTVSMLPMNQTKVHAASSTLLSESGTLNPDEEINYDFSVSTLSKVDIIFSNCSGGEFDFEVIDMDTGDDVFEGKGYARGDQQVYTTKLQAGDYILNIQEDDDVSFAYQVEVKSEASQKVSVKSVKLSKSTLTLGVGKEYDLRATITPSNATNKDIIWYSSNYAVASVDDDGEVKGRSPGKATITAKVGGKTAKCTVYVMSTSFEINVKQTKSLASNFKYIKNYKKGKWSSSNKSVVSVSKSGKIKGLKKGTAKITLKVDSKKYVTTVYVYDKDNLRSTAEKKLRSLLDNPETLVINDVKMSKNRITIRFTAMDDDGEYDDGIFVGYYSKGRFKYYMDD